jgi:hypothetical protein
LDLQRVTVLAGLSLLAFACGKEFTAVDGPAGGAAGQAAGGTGAASGSAIGGDGAPDGGVETSGGASFGGSVSGGRGGVGGGSAGKANDGGSSVAGSGGSGGTVIAVPPIPLEGLELWFDADEVTQTNGVVSTWKDRSGYHRDALQPSTMSRPKLGKLNGKAALVFDGEDDYLRIDSIPGDFSKGVSMFVMLQQDVDETPCTAFFEASNGPEIDDVHLGTWQSALLYEVADKWVNATEHPLVLGAPQLVAAVHRPSLAVDLRRDTNTVADADFPLPQTIVREGFIGYTKYNDCHTLAGTIGEILVYSRGVTDSELIQVESYLNTRWDCCAE